MEWQKSERSFSICKKMIFVARVSPFILICFSISDLISDTEDYYLLDLYTFFFVMS